ncbi:hypothetical protein D9615_000482 [Tricholomella constricta]|uniref:Uncharacterized protein n=1 Tax=Tricholomella constricta TaxID=117010 RepID=A0A8H5HRH0_9AGAR|nr:hypothetical protein D9615_000482 [Tricholomella constricta]
MPQKLQDLERQNAIWQSDNVKLFQDNRSLTRALQENEIKHKNTVHVLESQVQKANREKAQMQKQNEALVAGQTPAYRQLLIEYQRLQGHYTAALHEISSLRHHIEVSAGRATAQLPATTRWKTPQVTPSPQQQIPRLPIQRPLLLPPAQASGTQFAQPAVVPSQQPGNHGVEGQVAVNKQAPFASKIHHALSIVADWRSHNAVHESVHTSLPRSNSTTSTQSRPVSRPSSATGTSSRAVVQPSLSVNTTHPPINDGHPHLPPTPMSAVTIRQRHLLSSTPHPGPPNIIIKLPKTSPAPTSTPVSPLNAATPIQPHPSTPPSLPGANTPPQEQDVKPLQNSPVEPAEDLDKPVHSLELISTDKTYDSVSPAEPIEVMIPTDVTPGDDSVISIDLHEQASLKRPSSALSPLKEQHESKKPRLGEEVQADGVTPAVAQTEPELAGVQEEDDEESEDGDIEIGPDGLRLVEDCLGALIDDDEENEEVQTCRLCMARFKMGYASEPKPFLRATTEELVQHCSIEHHDAWDALRRTV